MRIEFSACVSDNTAKHANQQTRQNLEVRDMKILQCPRGHFYDAEKHDPCPYCPGYPIDVSDFTGQPEAGDVVPIGWWRPEIAPPPADIAKCAACGRFYSQSESGSCPFCGDQSIAAQVRAAQVGILRYNQNGYLYSQIFDNRRRIYGTDPVEQSVFVIQIKPKLEALIAEQHSSNASLRFYPDWRIKQDILKNRFFILSRSPSEMTPGLCID